MYSHHLICFTICHHKAAHNFEVEEELYINYTYLVWKVLSASFILNPLIKSFVVALFVFVPISLPALHIWGFMFFTFLFCKIINLWQPLGEEL